MLTFLPLMEDGRTGVVLALLSSVRVLLAAALMHALLSHDERLLRDLLGRLWFQEIGLEEREKRWSISKSLVGWELLEFRSPMTLKRGSSRFTAFLFGCGVGLHYY